MNCSWDELVLNPQFAFPEEEWESAQPEAGVMNVLSRLRSTRREIDLERARITTRSYRGSEGQPMPLRRAKMLLEMVTQMSITIYDDEMIVANRSLLPRMGVIAPEGAVEWIDAELETLATRPQDRFEITAEQIRELRQDIFPYWRGKTLEDEAKKRIPTYIHSCVEGKAFTLNQTDHAQGHILPDTQAWLRLGIGGLCKRVEEARSRNRLSRETEVFYQAAGMALEAAQVFIRRYAQLATWLAQENPDERRVAKLEDIAQRCTWLSENPPRSFPEALQMIWFLFVLLQVESNASSFSPGRLDQYLLPYMEADMSHGRLTLQQAQTWLEYFWLKFNEIVLLRSSSSARYFAGFPIGFNIVLGGQKADMTDATNLLSYMCLRAQAELGLTQPNLSIRIHKDSPQAFLRCAAFVISKGSGMPQVFNDEVIIPGQIGRGIERGDAQDYAVVGCVELSNQGKALGWSDAAMFNLVRVLELTLFGGKEPHSGEQIGLATPPLTEMQSLEDLEKAYDAQLQHFVGLMVEGCKIVDGIHAEMLPSPMLSLVIQDCLERGRDVTGGGAYYNFSGVQGVQVANLADSLAALEQALFTEHWVSAQEMLEALCSNFEGRELLRQKLINRVPKYGNDDDRVDKYAQRWADRYSELVARYTTRRGGIYQPGFYTVSAHVPMGANVGATPDGRLSGEPLADGGVSPSTGMDRKGATAVLKSVSKMNLELASNGTLLNMKFLPSFFNGSRALDKFVMLLRGFSRLKIPHVQFNVVSAETLRAAQEHPHEYKNLVVRVAGYSAYFTELDRKLQDEIIARTAFGDTG